MKQLLFLHILFANLRLIEQVLHLHKMFYRFLGKL